MKEMDQMAEKQRFGLFSSLPPLAVGDNSY